MFATGYVHAQDRLWQMDMMRRAGEGRLSEILGTPTIEYDRLFRTLGLSSLALKILQEAHPETRLTLEAYAEGVNAFITSNKGRYPAEFDMLNYEPEPWRPEHSVLVARLMAWELNLAWWTDLTFGEIAEKVSPEKLREIIPTFPDSIGVTVPRELGKKNLSDIHDLLDIGRSYRNYFGLGSAEAGSNAWAVDSSRSLSGAPILANDPHLAMPAPSRWYEVHLSAPGWNVEGVSLPGAPVVVIGHNDHLAWGLTNAMLDDADFYVEKVDSTNPDRYMFQKSAIPFEVHEEIIRVKGNDSIVFSARVTQDGPVISDVHPTRKHQDSASLHSPIAMRWTGLEISDELYGFYLMNRAQTYRDFELGMKEITVPGQSVVYADVRGNIAYWTTGRIPIRGKEQPMIPLKGWTGEGRWKGFVPFEEMPKLLNPHEGFVACANQKIADARYPYYLSTLWEPPSRIQRIRELLRSTEKFSVEDFKQFQQDITSPYARDIVQELLESYQDTANLTGHVSDALNYLRNWDYRLTQSDVTTTIFNVFVVKLFHNTFEDEMGEDVFNDFVFFGAIPYRVTSQLSDTSSWFDDAGTQQVETKQDMLRRSLSDAVNELRARMGDEMKTWRWGELHTVTFKHPFGARPPLDRVFNIGPFPLSGGGTTVMKTEYRFTTPYSVSVGPSMRQIVDMAQPHEAYTVITSGQSGQALHVHYDDQAPLWLNGGYHQVTMDWQRIKNAKWDHLELKPE
jgi:penicillin amidase